MSVKEPSQIPLHIVEDHNEALSFILRGIGSKYLDFDNNLLVHFDSHPDLLLNTDLKAADIFDKETLLEKVSIETWILPLNFAGHVATIVWIKPKWSNQIDEGCHTFYIGETKEKDIKISSPMLYFIGALNYAPFEDLIDPKKIILHVLTIDESEESITKCKTQVQKLIKEHDNSYLLDIDLDFFSTLNPFLGMFPAAKMYERLKVIYKLILPKSQIVLPVRRTPREKAQIDTLQKISKL
ncbi:UNVERIFIED_CONTAM: hypothetical protein GTU68_016323 [Idotea baltica]|nr:hypothetical protein [Idotea baltica]